MRADERNTFIRNRQTYLSPWNRLGPLDQPYARLIRDSPLRYGVGSVAYTPWPLMRTSAIVDFGEVLYNQLEARWAHRQEVSKQLLLEMATLAQGTQSHLLLADVAEDVHTRDMLALARSEGQRVVDISVDFRRPASRNLPHDSHPTLSRAPPMPSALSV